MTQNIFRLITVIGDRLTWSDNKQEKLIDTTGKDKTKTKYTDKLNCIGNGKIKKDCLLLTWIADCLCSSLTISIVWGPTS